MEKPTTAILDGDLIAYKAACWAEKNAETKHDLVERLQFDVDFWTPQGCTTRLIAFSCSRSDNYRKDFWPSYKENRAGKPAPRWLPVAKQIIEHREECVQRPRLEADDLMGIAMSSGHAITVSLDKDMQSVPGWFWNPDKLDFPKLISEEEADNFFYKQWIMGDSTDGIPGIYKVGPKKAEAYLDGVLPQNRDAAVMALYEQKGCDYDYCMAQARCIRILRAGEYDKEEGTPHLYNPGF